MPRNSSGNYTPPAGNPVVTDTTITSTWANALVSDLGAQITSSLDRSGRGGMLAPLKGFDGSSGVPGYGFTAETTTGMFRAGAGELGFSILGNQRALLDDLLLELFVDLTINGDIISDGLWTHTGDVVVDGQISADPGTDPSDVVVMSQLSGVTSTPEVDLASAATTDIGAQAVNKINITGTTSITSFGTTYKGPIFVRFSGSLLLTHSSTLVLPYGGENFQTQAGDTFILWPKATTGVSDGWLAVPVGATTTRLASGTTGIRQGTIFKATAGFTVNTGLIPDTVYTGVNNSASNITITQGSGVTLRQSGTTNTGNRTILPRAEFRIWALSTTEYYISGTGVT